MDVSWKANLLLMDLTGGIGCSPEIASLLRNKIFLMFKLVYIKGENNI